MGIKPRDRGYFPSTTSVEQHESTSERISFPDAPGNRVEEFSRGICVPLLVSILMKMTRSRSNSSRWPSSTVMSRWHLFEAYFHVQTLSPVCVVNGWFIVVWFTCYLEWFSNIWRGANCVDKSSLKYEMVVLDFPKTRSWCKDDLEGQPWITFFF